MSSFPETLAVLEIEIRRTDAPTDVSELEELQVAVWGGEPVPGHQLIAAARNGGSVLVAESGGAILGFCYGFSAGSYLVSHLLAVHPQARRQGLARRLKLAQLEWARGAGFQEIRWTFDPLRAVNAHFNLNCLGATAAAYHDNYYGVMEDGLNAGGPTDRLEIRWPCEERLHPVRSALQPLIVDGTFHPSEKADGWFTISIPSEYPPVGEKIRHQTQLRQAFRWAFSAGYRAVDFGPQGYVLRPW
jgi:chorismate synthase